jgi:ABC-type dipeptide/oligopeptide/nickel transport system permease subunit
VTLVAFAGFVLVVVVWSYFPPYPPIAPVAMPLEPPSAAHWAGVDDVGRDIFSRILVGARMSLAATFVVIGLAMIVGGLVGLVAGALGGWLDALLMRVTDLFLALPAAVLAIAIAAALGRSLEILVLSMTLVWWPGYARIVRGQVHALMNRSFIEAAHLSGIKRRTLFAKHLLPGTSRPLLVAASMDIAGVILTLAALSFLGLGAPQPAPELGSMAANGMAYILSEWWVPIMPALMVFVLGFAGNVSGDAVRDLLKAGEVR